MSVRLGNPQEIVQAAKATGGAAGVVISLGGSANQWLVVVSIFVTYVASASAGSRTPSVIIKDAAGLILWQSPIPTALTATNTLLIALGGALPVSNQTGPPIMQFVGFPDNMTVPANGTITVQDTANISATDTVAANIVVSN